MTPGGPAPLAELAGANASDAAEQPSPQFPLNLVAVRLQAADYRSLSTTGYGEGRFSVIAPPELLTPPQLQSLAQWPQIATAAIFDAALLPEKFDSLADLRLAAAKMQADVLLVYTIATTLPVDGPPLAPAHKVAPGTQTALGVAGHSTDTL